LVLVVVLVVGPAVLVVALAVPVAPLDQKVLVP
jgi:hypothetical protein